MKCINCGTLFESENCPHCGLSRKNNRILYRYEERQQEKKSNLPAKIEKNEPPKKEEQNAYNPKVCPVCGCKLGVFGKVKTSDGVICARCADICQSYATMPTSAIKGFWEVNNKRWESFETTKILSSLLSEPISIDIEHRLFVFGNAKGIRVAPIVFAFDEVEGYGFKTVGGKTVTKTKGGITRAVVGGAVAGPVGALVGSGTAKTETTTEGGSEVMTVYFTMHSGNMQRESSNYPKGFTAFLDRCIAEKQAKLREAPTNTISAADEIAKYKGLMDAGAITEEEFAAMKRKLLGL